MQKKPAPPAYDPKLPNQVFLEREAGKNNVPKQPAANPGTTSPSPQEVKRQAGQNSRDFDDESSLSGEAELSTLGEEQRPKDGTLDGGTAR